MIMQRRRALLGCAAIWAGALTGCSLLPERPYQERREWPLDVRRRQVQAARPHGQILLVRSIRAAPGLNDRGLRTLRDDGAEHVDYWEEWAVPPPQGVESVLRQWLQDSGKFAAVVTPGSELRADLVLEGELLGLAVDLPHNQAHAEMSIVLLRTGAGRATPVLQRSFSASVPVAGHDGAAEAAALREAIAAIMHDIENAV